ncbi:hypothetical protein [Streptomyces uncialis]|uniref:hypothetical protein n=1 Tax=Streptomyces uncialis TaxID=1048205 RepID=UPI002F918D06|nr:hypothetical protein OG268_36975 [Streptomyces uncialis]
MTTTDTAAGSSEGLSGVDLARVALANARATARTLPQTKRRTGASTRRARGNGRDPLPFGAALTQMMAERGWDTAAPAPGTTPGTTPVREEPAPAGQPTGPRPQSPGYLAALAAHQEHRTTRDSGTDARVRAAAESQAQRLRRNREPEEAFTEITAQKEILREQHARAHASDRLEASVRAALAYKRRGEVSAPAHQLSAAS